MKADNKGTVAEDLRFSWSTVRSGDGLNIVIEMYPNGSSRQFHDVPDAVVTALIAERRSLMMREVLQAKERIERQVTALTRPFIREKST